MTKVVSLDEARGRLRHESGKPRPQALVPRSRLNAPSTTDIPYGVVNVDINKIDHPEAHRGRVYHLCVMDWGDTFDDPITRRAFSPEAVAHLIRKVAEKYCHREVRVYNNTEDPDYLFGI